MGRGFTGFGPLPLELQAPAPLGLTWRVSNTLLKLHRTTLVEVQIHQLNCGLQEITSCTTELCKVTSNQLVPQAIPWVWGSLVLEGLI
jgi:hypothetical protein